MAESVLETVLRQVVAAELRYDPQESCGGLGELPAPVLRYLSPDFCVLIRPPGTSEPSKELDVTRLSDLRGCFTLFFDSGELVDWCRSQKPRRTPTAAEKLVAETLYRKVVHPI